MRELQYTAYIQEYAAAYMQPHPRIRILVLQILLACCLIMLLTKLEEFPLLSVLEKKKKKTPFPCS